MRILYGIQGTGNGYPARARALAKWIKDDRQLRLEELAESLWGGLELPVEYNRRFGRSFMSGLIC
jgi:hypothetical protein